jgi:hypothetical protein
MIFAISLIPRKAESCSGIPLLTELIKRTESVVVSVRLPIEKEAARGPFKEPHGERKCSLSNARMHSRYGANVSNRCGKGKAGLTISNNRVSWIFLSQELLNLAIFARYRP